LQFELSLREKRRVLLQFQNENACADLNQGVKSFERNIKRLGISDDGSCTKMSPIKGTGLEHLEMLEKRVDSLHFRPSSNIQMMKDLRERRKLQLNAQKERASRRRKMLVDQTRNIVEVCKGYEFYFGANITGYFHGRSIENKVKISF